MNPKVSWAIFGVFVVVVLGYLASRVGNIGARSVRDGEATIDLSLSEPVLPGVAVKASWTTPLGEDRGSVILKARAGRDEVIVGQGEFAAGQATVVIPCELGGEEIG